MPVAPQDPIQPIKPIDAQQSSGPRMVGPRRSGLQLPTVGAKMPSLPQLGDVNLRLSPLRIGRGGRQSLAAPTDPISSVYEKPPVVDEHSVTGWFKNLSDDFGNFIHGIPAAFKIAATSTGDIVRNRKWLPLLMEHPDILRRELEKKGVEVIKGFTDTYKDGLDEAAYKHPFTVTLDALGIFGAVGAGLKGAGIAARGRTAGMAARAAKRAAGRGALEEVMARAANPNFGDKLIRLGESIETAPGRLIGAGIKKSWYKAQEVFPQLGNLARKKALTPLGIEENKRFSSYQLQERATESERGLDIIKKSLKKSEWDEFQAILDGEKPLDTASSQRIKDRAEMWSDKIAEDQKWFLETNFRSFEELEQGKLKNLAIRLYEKGELKKMGYDGPLVKRGPTGEASMSQEAIDLAKRWAEGENPFGRTTTPTYSPYFTQAEFDLAEFLSYVSKEDTDGFLQYVSRFEKKTGRKPHITDPDVITARAAAQLGNLKAVVKYIGDGEARGIFKSVPGASRALPGHVFINKTLLQKYVKDLGTGYQQMVRNVTEELAKTPNDVLGAYKRGFAKTTDGVEWDGLPEQLKKIAEDPNSWELQVPEEVAYILQSNLNAPKGIIGAYDKVLNTWRHMVLSLMPRYYLNNLLGNAALLMFAGHTGMTKVAGLSDRNLPGEVMNGMLAAETGMSSDFLKLPKSVRRMEQYLSDVTDTRPKQVLFLKNLKEMIERDAMLGNTELLAKSALKEAEAVIAEHLDVRHKLMDLGLEEMLKTRQASLNLQAGGPRKYIDPIQRSRVDQLQRDVKLIQEKIKRGRTLQAASGSIQDLEAQLKMKMAELGRVAPTLPFDIQSLKNMPEVRQLVEIQEKRRLLAPTAARVDRALEKMERFLGNYGRLHPIEREVIRRVIPFWTFARTMNQLVATLPFTNPARSFLWHHYSKMMIDATNDDRLPRRYRNMIPVGGNMNGDIILLRLGSFNPFEAVGTTMFANLPIPKFMDPANNPFIKMVIESKGGYDTFTERPFTKRGEDFVMIDGRVMRWDGDRKRFETVIPQKGPVRSVLDQIPHVKVIRELLDSFTATRGATPVLGTYPSLTPRNVDGTYTYNRQWWYALSRLFGMPIQVSNPEQVQQQHRAVIKSIARRARGLLRRGSPQEREQVEKILQDVEQGGWVLWED